MRLNELGASLRPKFNRFERAAGIFILGAFLGFFFLIAGLVVKKGWFDKKSYYFSEFDNADGVRAGTLVQISGLNAGQVSAVDLTSDNKIRVEFYISEKFVDKIKADTSAQLIRPYIIGERVLEVTVGTSTFPKLAENSKMESREGADLMTLLSGRKLNESLQSMTGMIESLRYLADAFLEKGRTQNMVKMFDRIEPLLKNFNVMTIEMIKLAQQANKDEKFGVVLSELAQVSQEFNRMIPQINAANPEFGKDLSMLVKNMDQIAREFKVVLPALAEIAPDLPKTSRRAVEALNEAVILMKGMQKSYFLRSGVKEVKEEENPPVRQPADMAPKNAK